VVVGTTVVALEDVPLTVTWNLTFASFASPPLVKLNVNFGAGVRGIVFVDPLWSVVPATLTESSEWP
jgi:hypothetical protein